MASCLQAAEKKKEAVPTAPFRIHPKIFSYIEGWLSDGESPVVTEINLDAVEASKNQFQTDEIKEEDGWIRAKGDGDGFRRYRVIEHKGDHYRIEYQENGGGSLTTSSTVEFSVGKRQVRVDDKAKVIRVLRVISYSSSK